MANPDSPNARQGIDLVAAIVDLRDNYKSIASQIKRFRDAHSAHTDLSSALDMLLAVKPAAGQAEHGCNWAPHTVPALIYSAVMLYARATKSTSDHRSTLDLRKHFNDDQRAVHQRLCDLRDDAFAHFGPGLVDNGNAWNEERVLLPVDRPEEMGLLALSKRVSYFPPFVQKAILHVQRALLLTQREMQRREERLIEAIENGLEDDQFMRIMAKHLVDLDVVLKGSAAPMVLDLPSRVGVHTGLVWDS